MSIPPKEKTALSIAKNMKGIKPISDTLNGKLKIPVPIALANNANIDPLKDPS